MTDREKLLKLWADLGKMEFPVMDRPRLQTLVNTISSGIEFIKQWLVDEFKKE